MAEVPVTMNGVLYDLYNRTTQRVVFIGDASLSGLSVGGGPVYPPSGGGQPPGSPAFPIWGPPGSNFPDKPGYPPVAGHPLPEPPQQPPEGPTDDNGFIKPPPGDGGWSYHEQYGWGYYPGGSGAGPKR